VKAFYKTLFGDVRNVGVVAVLVAIEAMLLYSGHGREAVYIVPALILVGIGWLALR
jgi:hypothetical protein